MFILSPQMELPIPSVGTQPAPDYALNVNQCLTIIDAHNHTPGSGSQITPNALDLNADVDFQENNALNVRSVRLVSHDAPIDEPADLDCVYVSLGDLYYNDGDGNQVRITQNGAIAGSPGSIANLEAPASASYDSLSETFIWQSDVDKAASMDMGSLIIREMVTNGFGVTIEASNSIGADYTLTLPASQAPSASSLLLTNVSGVMSFLTLGSANQVLKVNSAGTAVEYGLVGKSSLASLSVGQSDVANFATNSTTYVDVNSQSANITTTGRPVFGILVPADLPSNPGVLSYNNASGTPRNVQIQVVRVTVGVGSEVVFYTSLSLPANTLTSYAPSVISFLDLTAGAGDQQYSIIAKVDGGGATFGFIRVQLRVYEVS